MTATRQQQQQQQAPSSDDDHNRLAFRSYRPEEDEEACELLEERANQFKNTRLRNVHLVGGLLYRLQEDLLQVHMSHGDRGFDARAKTGADDYEVIVCEVDDDDNGDEKKRKKIVAVVLINIQTVVWDDGSLMKVGWVYGLRVDQQYQRRGIGRRLSNEAERRCLDKGVSLLYLTVNVENEKARALYGALGYQPASRRKQSAVFLANKERAPNDDNDDIVVVRLSPDTAASLLCRHYDKTDLSLPSRDDYVKLLSSIDCEGTLLAVRRSDLPENILHQLSKVDINIPGAVERSTAAVVEAAVRSGGIPSYGGVSLWNTSAVKGVRVVRLIVKKETWLSLPFQASLLAAAATPLALWGYNLVGRIVAAFNDSSTNVGYFGAGILFLESLGCCIVSRYVYKAARFVRFIVTRDSRRLQAKAFGAFKHGPDGLECLKDALTASRAYARSKGYGVWILNADQDHPDRSVFPQSGFRTIWMQKWLTNKDVPTTDGTTDNKWPLFSPTAFCDPRNV